MSDTQPNQTKVSTSDAPDVAVLSHLLQDPAAKLILVEILIADLGAFVDVYDCAYPTRSQAKEYWDIVHNFLNLLGFDSHQISDLIALIDCSSRAKRYLLIQHYMNTAIIQDDLLSSLDGY